MAKEVHIFRLNKFDSPFWFAPSFIHRVKEEMVVEKGRIELFEYRHASHYSWVMGPTT